MRERREERKLCARSICVLAALSGVMNVCVSSALAGGAPAQAGAARGVPLPPAGTTGVGDFSEWVGVEPEIGLLPVAEVLPTALADTSISNGHRPTGRHRRHERHRRHRRHRHRQRRRAHTRVGNINVPTIIPSDSSAAGPSAPASSAQSAVVSAAGTGVQHVEYVLENWITSVYDMDHEYKLIKTILLPQTEAQVRGVTVAPSTHQMFIPFGGDGPINGSGNGSVLAYDLVAERLTWEVHLASGIDSGQVSPDGARLYIPSGENTSSGIWNVLSAASGESLGTIQGGSGAHNTVVANDGAYVYLGGRLYDYLDVYETATGKVKQVGPLIGTVRPFTVNGSNTLAFTTATGFDGFQVSSLATGKVLFTVSFGAVPGGFPYSAPSHGIALSPDEKTIYVLDTPHKQVQFYDVSHLAEGVAPAQLGVVAVSGLSGEASPCAYDCGRSGWLQLSRDGRFLFVGDSGEVIETATRKVITVLPTLVQTKVSIEVDWQNGVPVATSGRTGVGYVG